MNASDQSPARGSFVREFAARYSAAFSRRGFVSDLAVAMLGFCAAVVISFYAIAYATERASNPVTDIVLSNTPTVNLDGVFAVATLLLITSVVAVLLYDPKRIPFSLNALTLFFIIRSGFISLTHIGPYPSLPPDENWSGLTRHFLFGGDLFFSGHVGTPFLLALMFWRQRTVRVFFLTWSVVMAVIVLLGHLHYSIDVASAYFITYTIFVLAERFFPDTRALFFGGTVPAK